MSKDEVIILRVTKKQKKEMQIAAFSRGVTLSTFMLEAAQAFASSQPKSCRTLAATLAEAKKGGAMSYADVGREVVNLLAARLEFMHIYLKQDEDELLAWLNDNLAGFMKQIPKRRRREFLKGIINEPNVRRRYIGISIREPIANSPRQVKSR